MSDPSRPSTRARAAPAGSARRPPVSGCGGVSRRGLLVGAAVAGSALATDPKAYALHAADGLRDDLRARQHRAQRLDRLLRHGQQGRQRLPARAVSPRAGGRPPTRRGAGAATATSSTATPSARSAPPGCRDHICDSRCWNCSCGKGSTATCDQRGICCNAFRYGQCNTQVKCSGGVHCRVVSCVAPYKWDNCTTTSFRSDPTAEHSSPYLPQWGPMEQHYTAMGGQRSYLSASTGPIRSTVDGTAKYVELHGRPDLVDERDRRLGDELLRPRALRRVRRPSRLGYPTGAAHHAA